MKRLHIFIFFPGSRMRLIPAAIDGIYVKDTRMSWKDTIVVFSYHEVGNDIGAMGHGVVVFSR